MKVRWSYFILLMVVIVLSACQGSAETPPVQNIGQDSAGLPPVAAVKAREQLATELDIDIEEISIVSQEQTTWLDSCLGLGGPAESCLRTDVDGWLVKLSSNGVTYVAHTDWLGEQIRFEP